MDEQEQPLRIESMSLTNFRGIASVDIDFHPQLTLIAGRNGVGKTTILQGVFKCFCALTNQKIGVGYSVMSVDKLSIRKGGLSLPEATLNFYENDDSIKLESVLGLDARLAIANRSSVMGLVPVSIYYSQDRAIVNSRPKRDLNPAGNSSDASLNAVSTFKQWFFEKEADEGLDIRDSRNIDFRNHELEAIRRVVNSIDGIVEITSRAEKGKERDLYFKKYGKWISIDQLSSGERVYFILAADLARRLIVAFPNKEISQASALVLIDEIELHLHPAWQRKIIKQLRETFASCQFIIATHSPQVVGGVEAECVRLLSAGEDGIVSVKTPSASYGRDSNYILEALLDADERVGEVDDLIDAARDAIDQGNFDAATNLLETLETTIEGDAPIVNILRARLRRLQGNVERAS